MTKGRPKQIIKNGKKQCSQCKKWFPLIFFKKAKHLSSGRNSRCKECIQRWEQTPIGIWTYLKRGKKRKISKEEFSEWYNKQEKRCVYCGQLPLKERLQVDRKDNNNGYKIGNMVLACKRCNFIKRDWFSYKEMVKIGKVIKEFK